MIPFYITRYDILYLVSWSIFDQFPVVYYRYINSNQYNLWTIFPHINLIGLASPKARTTLSSETTCSLDGGTHNSRSPLTRRHDYMTDTCTQTQSRTTINKPARLYIHTPNVTYISYFRGTCILVVLELKYYSRPVRAGPSRSGGLFPEPDPPASPRTYSTNHVYLHRFSRLRFWVCV